VPPEQPPIFFSRVSGFAKIDDHLNQSLRRRRREIRRQHRRDSRRHLRLRRRASGRQGGDERQHVGEDDEQQVLQCHRTVLTRK